MVDYLICTPLSALFTGAGQCGSTTAAYVSISALDVVLGVAVFTLPMPPLLKLQVDRQTKFALVATFALGLFTIVAGTMRLVSVVRIDFQTDVEQGQLGAAYWSAIELSVGIIVACAMTLRPLLDRMLPKIRQYSYRLTAKSRRSAANEPSTGSRGFKEESSFVRLHESQHIPLEVIYQGDGDSMNDTRRASLEYV